MLQTWAKNSNYYLQQTLVCTAMVLLMIGVHYLHFRSHTLMEWGPFFLLGAILPVLCYVHPHALRNMPLPIHPFMVCFLLPVIVKALSVFLKAHHFIIGAWVLSLVIVTSLHMAQSIYQQKKSFLPSKHDQLTFYGISMVWTMTIWCALFQLPNWGAYISALESHPWSTIIISLVSWLLAKKFVLGSNDGHVTQTLSWHYECIFFTAFFLLILTLGFRSDALFIDGSAFHWAYYVGPVETVRNHGWLLWDTPSQYGFLNIFIAAMLPTESAWQAVYLLQGILLTLVGVMLYAIVRSLKNTVQISIGLLIGICALHFADPVLEGPAPFPSSSVMRFFWSYTLLFSIYQYWKWERLSFKAWSWIGSLCWVLAILWSAESAIYSTCIFVPVLGIGWLQEVLQNQDQPWRNNLKQAFITKKYLDLLLPLFLLSGTIVGISLYYRFYLGHYPDWISHFLYGLLYANGFGSYPLNPVGSVWILLLLLAGLVTLFTTTIHQGFFKRSVVLLVGLIGCLWSISSYFVGRAVPNNITAMLPLLVMILFIALQINARKKTQESVILLQAFAAPFLFMVLFTVLGNPALKSTVLSIRSFSTHINQQVPTAAFESELLSLMHTAKITPDAAIIYSGYVGLLPRLNGYPSHERVWLSSPLQLLEDPVPAKRQALIVQRFVIRSQPADGYLVHAKEEAEAPYTNWTNILNRHFIQTANYESDHWIILHFQYPTQTD